MATLDGDPGVGSDFGGWLKVYLRQSVPKARRKNACISLDRELGDPKDVAELARHELRERGASGGSRRSEKRRKLYQDGVEAAADPENGRGDVQPLHGDAENHVHSPG